MSSFKKEIVKNKLSEIKKNLQELEKVASLSYEAYLADNLRKKGIEKTIIDIVQGAIDINT